MKPGAPRPDPPDEAEWTYAEQESWAETHAPCGGARQSPIDITSPESRRLPGLEFVFASTEGVVDDTLDTIRIRPEGGALRIDGVLHALRYITIHLPGEHHIDGQSYDAELQLAFVDPDTNDVIVAVPVSRGGENGFIEEVIEQMEGERSEVDVDDMLPSDLDYFTYDGSLTHPPCTEGVRWIVLRNAIEISGEQLDDLRRYHDGNARRVQPLNGRRVLQSG